MSPLVHGYVINSDGEGKKINTDVLAEVENKDEMMWLHLQSGHKKARSFLEDRSNLSNIVIENLLSAESRPSIQTFQKGTLITLRAINYNENAAPEDMVGINIWIESNRIITMRKSRILAIEDIVRSIDEGNGPTNTAMFLSQLIRHMNKRTGEVIAAMENESDDLESQIIEKKLSSLRPKLSLLRKRIIILRRYVVPQREVFYRLHSEDFFWMDELSKHQIRDSSERLIRYIEDLDTTRDHLMIGQEELSNIINEDMNKTMYRLSIVSVLFLPLGFLTGLLGINVAGIPGDSNEHAFLIVCMISLLFLVSGYGYFKYKKTL